MKLRFDGWVLDPESGDLERAGSRIRLQEQPVQVLRELIAHAGSVVTREQLIALLWPKGVVDFDTGLNTVIRKLRSALGDTSETPRYIETLPRRGYRFIGALDPDPEAASAASARMPVSTDSGMSPGPAPPAHDGPTALPESALATAKPMPSAHEPAARDEATSSTAPVRRPRLSPLALIVALAAAALLTGVYALWRARSGAGVTFAPPPHSIAVLPLANESGEASQQYFSDGISEDLITALSQFPGLKVIGRTSAFQFRDSKEDSRSIGAKLRVAHLLEGSVRRSGEMVRVSAELIDTTDGSTQWSERYDRPYKDLFALQDEITRAVAGALRAKLLPGEHAAAQTDRPPGGSLEAYNAYLQGRFYGFRATEADYRKAIESYTQATQLDPRYALAWSEQAGGWTGLGGYLEGPQAQVAYAKAREAADRALALSPELAAAHVARGFLLQRADFDWRGAEAEYRRAMGLAPNDGAAKFYLGTQLATFGELEPAIELTRQALATEPLRANWYRWLSIYLSGLNRVDEAERAIRRALELQPAAAGYHEVLTIIEVQRGHAQAALAAAQQEPHEAWQDSALALARQIGGDRSAAEAALQSLINKDANRAAYQIAEAYALRNDAKATFEWLDRAWSNRDAGVAYLLFDPFILRYKDDPRFAAFCRKAGLPVPGETSSRKST